MLTDFFPLLLFFAAYTWQGIYVATGVAIVASVVQIAWIHWKHGRAGVVHWTSFAIIVLFGGATLVLQDESFIMWKPTVLYAVFGAILAVGKVVFRRDLLAHLMKGVEFPASVWTRLTWAWVAFFAFMSVANWYVAFHFTEQAWVLNKLGLELGDNPRLKTWVLFKVWGGTGLVVLFALLLGFWLSRHADEEAA